MSACSIELPDNVQRGRPVESRGPGVARSSGSGRWGCEIEEPASTRPAEILVGRLYIASAVQASNWELLSDLKVTHIVNCSRSCNFDGTGSNPFSAEINYCSCGFADNASSDLTDALEQTWTFIETALSSHPRWVVLVHCASGISRSVALVCHYLMKKQRWSFQDSIQFIRCRHPAAAPNSSFVQQLKLVERQLLRQRLLAQCKSEEDGGGEEGDGGEGARGARAIHISDLEGQRDDRLGWARCHSENLDQLDLDLAPALPCAPRTASTRPVTLAAGWGRDFGFADEAEVDPV